MNNGFLVHPLQVPVTAVSLLCVFLVVLLMTGCSSFVDNVSYDLERQINLQNAQRELSAETRPQAKKSAEEYEVQGDLYLQKNEINRAYVQYTKGLAISPDKQSLLHKQAELLLQKKRLFEARTIYDRLLELDKNDALAVQGLGRVHFAKEQYREAENMFNQAIELNSQLSRSYEFLGLIHSSRKDFEQAILFFKKALAIVPTDGTVVNNLAVTYYLLGDFDKSAQLLESAAQKTGNRKMFNNLALAYFKLGKYEASLRLFKRGAENDAVAYNNMGYELLTLNKYQEAIDAFERAIALNPKYYPSAQNNLETAKQAFAMQAIDSKAYRQ